MNYEIDHIFILVPKNAPQAQLLIDFGLQEGPSRIHHGQGTANRCFFFNNVMLELLWVYDENEAQNKATIATTLWSRWNQTLNSPQLTSSFGLCLRPSQTNVTAVPFKAWKYQPDLFPKGMFVYIADSVTQLDEPFIFFAPSGKRQDRYIKKNIRNHRNGLKELTSISLHEKKSVESDAYRALLNNNIISPNSSLNTGIELQFDNGNSGNVKDFNPDLPLVFRW
ncbi:hypothetical protein MNBD_GAMMA22-2393 [hydrothermal vent metagenome]|uniref:Uncharacterized protein n=1 Tax=hydrothermal vent metagenome TaxID=652676 RepID=A0A3B0ZFL0_9ZZZZ